MFLGPFISRVMAERPGAVAAVFVAGRRSAGEKTRTLSDRLASLRILWLILGPGCFLRALLLRLRARLLGSRDPRSVAGQARKLEIPVHGVADPNSPEFVDLVRSLNLDLVLNQSELLLKIEILAAPKLGFVNRHGSLLPAFRGRLASFWSHAAQEPGYGVTIHFVDQGLDTGAIIAQQDMAAFIDPRWSYCRVAQELFGRSAALFWQAVDSMEEPEFTPEPQHVVADAARVFPTLDQAREYRRVLAERRKS